MADASRGFQTHSPNFRCEGNGKTNVCTLLQINATLSSKVVAGVRFELLLNLPKVVCYHYNTPTVSGYSVARADFGGSQDEDTDYLWSVN